jgi:hypothetical protein
MALMISKMTPMIPGARGTGSAGGTGTVNAALPTLSPGEPNRVVRLSTHQLGGFTCAHSHRDDLNGSRVVGERAQIGRVAGQHRPAGLGSRHDEGVHRRSASGSGA